MSATSSHRTGDSSEPYKTNVDLMDVEPLSKSTTTGEDSSAGSSGWDSSDGDSSVDTGSVDSYNLNDLGRFDVSVGVVIVGGCLDLDVDGGSRIAGDD